jgi:hypothetical protein
MVIVLVLSVSLSAVIGISVGSTCRGAQVLDQQQLQALRGGDCGTDCYEQATGGCNSEVKCLLDYECTVGKVVCDDETKKWVCQFDSNWDLWDCVVDPAHTCTPKKAQTGVCSWLSGGWCALAAPNLGPCGNTASQCHY